MGKTLAIHIADSNITRNILRTDVLRKLIQSEKITQIILLVHPKDIEKYKSEFSHSKIIVTATPLPRPTFLEKVFWFLAKHTIHTSNVRRKILDVKNSSTGSTVMRYMKYLFALSVFFVSKVPLFDVMIKKCTYLVFRSDLFSSVMERYEPDLLFAPVLFGSNDVRILKYCKKNNIPTVGMVKSWDNLLGKDPFLIQPDELIVHSETVEKIVIKMHKYPKEKIHVTGMPQFDVYSDKSYRDSKEIFFKELNLDPNKKLVVYAAMGSWIVLYEREIIQMLAQVVQGNELCEPAQLLVRLHPAYKSDDEFIMDIPGITIDRPGNSNFSRNPWRADFEFEEKDTKRLFNSLSWADVSINSGSTMTIDAAALDCPIINVEFDAGQEYVPLERSAKRLLIKDHYLPILESGGVDVVNSRDKLIKSINLYLTDRQRNREGRERIVREHCYTLDGQSGTRVADVLIDALQKHE